MKRFLILTAALLLLVLAKADAQNDARARQDLIELRQKYEANESMQAEVALEIKFPEQPAEVQKGTISQQGKSFRAEFAQQVAISDGETLWMYLPDNMEVQVYDATEGMGDGGFLNPQDLLTIYDSEDFEYALTGEITEGGTTYRQIEFKPTDRNSEFSKVRLTYDPRSDTVRRIKVFNKDGSRFALSLTSVKTGVAIPASTFAFNAKDYPGVMVEDMRL